MAVAMAIPPGPPVIPTATPMGVATRGNATAHRRQDWSGLLRQGSSAATVTTSMVMPTPPGPVPTLSTFQAPVVPMPPVTPAMQRPHPAILLLLPTDATGIPMASAMLPATASPGQFAGTVVPTVHQCLLPFQ